MWYKKDLEIKIIKISWFGIFFEIGGAGFFLGTFWFRGLVAPCLCSGRLARFPPGTFQFSRLVASYLCSARLARFPLGTFQFRALVARKIYIILCHTKNLEIKINKILNVRNIFKNSNCFLQSKGKDFGKLQNIKQG